MHSIGSGEPGSLDLVILETIGADFKFVRFHSSDWSTLAAQDTREGRIMEGLDSLAMFHPLTCVLLLSSTRYCYYWQMWMKPFSLPASQSQWPRAAGGNSSYTSSNRIRISRARGVNWVYLTCSHKESERAESGVW